MFTTTLREETFAESNFQVENKTRHFWNKLSPINNHLRLLSNKNKTFLLQRITFLLKIYNYSSKNINKITEQFTLIRN